MPCLDGWRAKKDRIETKRRKTMEEKNRTSELELTFECPKCGGTGVFEHLTNYTNIFVYEDGEIAFGDTEWWESDTAEYSCNECFWTIVDEEDCIIRDEAALIRWLRKEPKTLVPTPSETNGCCDDEERESPDGALDLEPGELRFVCPKCNGNQLDAVNFTATRVFAFDDGSVVYGKVYGGEYEHYRCHACRWKVEDEEHGCFDEPEILVSWLQANCDQSE